ncbi:MAG: hypothetical protein WKG01_16355 [Kofleriaceae bacterium]
MRGSKLAGSLVVHAVALVAITRTCARDEPAPRERAIAPVIELLPVEIVPLEVAVGSGGDAAKPASQPLERSAGSAPRKRAAISSDVTPGPELAPPAQPPSRQLAMRGLRHDLALPPGFAERAPATSAPEPMIEPRWTHDPKIKLAPSGGGTHVIRDRVATVRVAPDGTVAVTDVPDVDLRFRPPTPGKLKRRIARGISEWYADPLRDSRHGPVQDLPPHLRATPNACGSFNDPFCETVEVLNEQQRNEDMDDYAHWIVGGNKFKTDLTGWLHRKYIGDPYASRKLKVLDQTRAERVRIGAVHRASQLARSAEHVQRNLEAMWRTTTDPAARRSALFTLWDECAEGDDAAGAAGDRARAMVIGWIRSHLPSGGAAAYSAGELARLNASRTSRVPFAPYPKGTGSPGGSLAY